MKIWPLFSTKVKKNIIKYLCLLYWFVFSGDKLEPLYAPIRHKFASALTNWHPSDASAKVILQPWVGVFKDGHMEVFLRKHILPKLAMCMQEFPISPHQQVLGEYYNGEPHKKQFIIS